MKPPGAKRKRRRFRRRPGSSLRCFCSVEALLPTCCRPWSCRPEWLTRPCRAHPRQAPAEAEPTRSSQAPSVRRNCRTARSSRQLPSSFSGAEERRFRLSPCLRIVPGRCCGFLDDDDVALGTGGVLGERRGRAQPEGEGGGQRASSVSLRSPSIRVLGESVEALAALAVILSLRAYGPRVNVWLGEGFLPGRVNQF